jgi:acetylglutamate kinase
MSKPKLHVLKVGGRLIEQADHLAEVLAHFLQKEGHKLLIHGGGKRASELEKKLEIPTKMVDGRRITDAASLEIVVMVYAGLINKRLVSQLQSMHCNAVGLSGADGNVILAHKRPVKTIDYGMVGDIDQVNTHFVTTLLKANTLPVFCAITHDGKGQLLNTNADTIAATLARAMAEDFEVHAYFCLEKNGVLSDPEDDTAVLKKLDTPTYERLKADGTISAGMIPKLDNGFGALEKGVKEVVICGPDSFVEQGGTRLLF